MICRSKGAPSISPEGEEKYAVVLSKSEELRVKN
jgi:hypothetical protein